MRIQPSAQKANLIPIRELIDSQPMELDLREGEKYRVLEVYCANPDCKCGGVRLCFFKEGNNVVAFEAYLRIKDFTLDPEFLPPEKAEEHRAVIDEFFRKLTDAQKRRVVCRYMLAKGIGDPTDYIDFSALEFGECLSYEAVFGEEDDEVLTIERGGKHYFFHDQYCFNPSCRCNSVILEVFMASSEEVQEPLFVIDLDFCGEYEIKERKCTEGEVDEFFNDAIRGNERLFSVLKKRYGRMKGLGKMIQKQRLGRSRHREKVGRNDPCPCGSGKKYKNCCWLKEIGVRKVEDAVPCQRSKVLN